MLVANKQILPESEHGEPIKTQTKYLLFHCMYSPSSGPVSQMSVSWPGTENSFE